MRRALLLALVVTGLLAAVVLLVFSVSRFNVRGQGYADSLVDFAFLNAAQAAIAFDPHPAAFDAERAAFALRRNRATTANEVKRVAAQYVARWGEAAIPHLARAARQADAQQLEAIVRALAAIGGPATLPVLLGIIGEHRLFEHERPEDFRGQPFILRQQLVRALGATRTREAAGFLAGIRARVQPGNALWTPVVCSRASRTAATARLTCSMPRGARAAPRNSARSYGRLRAHAILTQPSSLPGFFRGPSFRSGAARATHWDRRRGRRPFQRCSRCSGARRTRPSWNGSSPRSSTTPMPGTIPASSRRSNRC